MKNPKRRRANVEPTKRQLASIANGQKSQGPKTSEGKARSSENSKTHGIFAINELNKYDQVNKADIDRFRNILIEEFNIKSTHQRIILELLINAFIGRIRCSQIANEIMHETVQIKGQTTIDDCVKGLSGPRLSLEDRAIADEAMIKRIELLWTRYEPRLGKEILKYLNELKILKKDQRINTNLHE